MIVTLPSSKYGIHACRWCWEPPTSYNFHITVVPWVRTRNVCSTTPLVFNLALSTSAAMFWGVQFTLMLLHLPSVGIYFLAVILWISSKKLRYCIRPLTLRFRGRMAYNPLVSSKNTPSSLSRCRTAGSCQSSSMIGAHAFITCTGSSGSSHQPSTSPECSLFGLFERLTKDIEKVFFQFLDVWTVTSFPFSPVSLCGDDRSLDGCSGIVIFGRERVSVVVLSGQYSIEWRVFEGISASAMEWKSWIRCSSSTTKGSRRRWYESKFDALVSDKGREFEVMISDAASTDSRSSSSSDRTSPSNARTSRILDYGKQLDRCIATPR